MADNSAPEWVLVYDLADATDYIAQIQNVTRTTKDFGIEPDPHLFGSDEWWADIERGAIATNVVEGTIETPLWQSMNDWPAVRIRHNDGEVSKWTREGDVTQYSKGRPIRLAYVVQHARKKSTFAIDPEDKVILKVWVGAGEWRPTAEYGAGPGRALDQGWEGGSV